MQLQSIINWPSNLSATRDATYESLSLLYREPTEDKSGEQLAFAVACSNHNAAPDTVKGCVHKLEVTTSPSFSQANIQVTHEVLPGHGPCSKIIDVHDKLKVACFDDGTVIPIKNFGYKKTFNCDVRAGLTHSSTICSIAADSNNCRMVSGGAAGEVLLYYINGEEIGFTSRTKVCTSAVTGLTYFTPTTEQDLSSSSDDSGSVSYGDGSILYSTQNGTIGLVDPRCELGGVVITSHLTATNPHFNISSVCLSKSQGKQIVYVGGVQGNIVSYDMRRPLIQLTKHKFPEDNVIRTMKEVLVPDGVNTRAFLAYTNGSSSIKILDINTMKTHPGWTCDRKPNGNQHDICQVGERLVSCGDNTSIGCWTWDETPKEESLS